MSGTVELVLAVEAMSAKEWMAGPSVSADASRTARRSHAAVRRGASAAPKRAARTSIGAGAGRPEDVGTAIADALGRMPGIEAIDVVRRSTARVFAEPAGAWRVVLMAADDGSRHIKAARVHELAPGVFRCETVCDEPLDAGIALALSDAFPQVLKDALGKPGKLAPSPALAMRRGTWRWSGADGAVVDLELSDARALFNSVEITASRSDEAAEAAESSELARGAKAAPASDARSPETAQMPIAFCELRLIARIEPAPAGNEPAAAASRSATMAVATAGRDAPAGGDTATTSSRDARGESESRAIHALFAAAGALVDALPVFPVLESGCERACAQSVKQEPARAVRTDLSDAKTPHAALTAIAAGVARQWFGNESGVRDGGGAETEFVHQMRVALRRLKTLLKTFPKWADERWERTIVPELDWLGGLLGRARDLDVFVDATLPALAGADVDAAPWAPLQARAAIRRHEAREQVRSALRSRRYAALSLAWLQWLVTQRLSGGPSSMAGKSLAHYAAKRVRKHYARLIDEPALSALTPAERHRRRIEAKRLRYTLEFFESLASHKTRRKVSKQLGRIQSVLGDGSDATAALHFLEALDVPPYVHGFARGWCEAVNRWSAIEGERLLEELAKPKILRDS